MRKLIVAFAMLSCLLFNRPIAAQQTGATAATSAAWAAVVANHYLVYPDRQYGVAGNIPLKLDVWQDQETKNPLPTVIYVHGGGWVFGDRTGTMPELLPYMQKGWNVVNVEYRMASQALAPAAVEDVRCALRWVVRNAGEYHFDTDRIIVTGHSAGGHLALMMGMLTAQDGFDNNCPAEPSMGEKPLKVAAIVNWFGITDVADLLSGPNRRTYAVEWLGGHASPVAMAKRVSPLTYVRPGLPPIITIQGDADPTVPYSDSVRLHQALDKAGDINQLVTVRGGKHGFQAFNDADTLDAYRQVFAFLYGHIPGLR